MTIIVIIMYLFVLFTLIYIYLYYICLFHVFTKSAQYFIKSKGKRGVLTSHWISTYSLRSINGISIGPKKRFHLSNIPFNRFTFAVNKVKGLEKLVPLNESSTYPGFHLSSVVFVLF